MPYFVDTEDFAAINFNLRLCFSNPPWLNECDDGNTVFDDWDYSGGNNGCEDEDEDDGNDVDEDDGNNVDEDDGNDVDEDDGNDTCNIDRLSI